MDETQILEAEISPVEREDDAFLELSSTKLDDLGKELNDRFENMRGFRDRATWEMEKAEALKAYHLEMPEKPIPYAGAANLRCIFTRLAVDSLHANHMYTIFGQGNQATVAPHYLSQDLKGRADRAAEYLMYQLAYEADFYTVMDDASRKDKIYGIAYLEPRYENQVVHEKIKYTTEEEVPDFDAQGNLKGTKTVKKTKTKTEKRTLFDGIKIESLPVESIFTSPYITSLDKAVEQDVVFKLTKHTLAKIKQQAKKDDDGDSFYMPGQVEKLRGIITNRLMEDKSQLEQARRLYDGFSIGWFLDRQIVELVQAHLWEDIDNDGKPENITVVFEAKTGVVLRVALTPCRIVEIKSRPVDERFFGEPTYRIIKPLCDEWESIHNARVNAGAWENTVFGVYRAGGRFNPEAQQIVPGHFYPVDDPREVQFIQSNRVGQSYFQEEGLLMQYVERILGLTDNIQGLPNTGDDTATETIAINQKASIRMSNPMNRIVLALEKLLNHMWDLNQQCAPSEKEFYVTGASNASPLFRRMTREDFAVQARFKLQVQNTFDKMNLQQTWLMAFKMFRPDPIFNMNPASLYELFTKTIQGLGLNLSIPKPPQADALSGGEVLEKIENGEDYDPMPGDDYDAQLKTYQAYMTTEEFEEWPSEQKRLLVNVIKKTKLLKSTLEKFHLNKSGVFDPGPMPGQNPSSPAMTMTPNPTQTFNTLRAGETGKSMAQQPMNAVKGAMMGGAR